jgi:hypothetical protein
MMVEVKRQHASHFQRNGICPTTVHTLTALDLQKHSCRPMTAYLENTPPSRREPAGLASPTPNFLAVTPVANRTYAASPQAQV